MRWLIAAATIVAAPVASAFIMPDQPVTAAKLLITTDACDPANNRLVFVSKDNGFDVPRLQHDPLAHGAVLRVLDHGGGAGSMTVYLASERWRSIRGGYKYTGKTRDPCRIAIIRDDKLIKVVCTGPAVTLAPPFVGAAALAIEIGSNVIRYCARFDDRGVIARNERHPDGTGTFKGTQAPPPPACLDCGNGSLDQGEQCDDSNRANGDCCSAGCRFEKSGSPCDDGNVCTARAGQCNGAGRCVSAASVPAASSTPFAASHALTLPTPRRRSAACPISRVDGFVLPSGAAPSQR